MNTSYDLDRVRSAPAALRRIDLNLFVLFDAIYSEGSLTGAANRLGLTQPAVSHALARLRNALDDKLFARQGQGVVPTPYARAIIEDVRRALELLRSGLLGERQFDPGTASATFRIALRAGMEARLLPALAQRLDREAPGIAIVTTQVARRQLETELASGDIDLAVDVSSPMGIDIRRHLLDTDRLIVAGRQNHPLLATGLALDSYLAARHLVVSSRRRGGAIEDYELSRQGLRRNIVLRCVSLSAAIDAIAQGDCLLTTGARQIETVGIGSRIAVHPFPLPAPDVELMLYWHESRDREPASQWLRATITSILQPNQ